MTLAKSILYLTMSVAHWISILCSLSALSSHPQNSAIRLHPIQPQRVMLYSLMVSMRHPSQYAHVFENLTPTLGRLWNLSETKPCFWGFIAQPTSCCLLLCVDETRSARFLLLSPRQQKRKQDLLVPFYVEAPHCLLD